MVLKVFVTDLQSDFSILRWPWTFEVLDWIYIWIGWTSLRMWNFGTAASNHMPNLFRRVTFKHKFFIYFRFIFLAYLYWFFLMNIASLLSSYAFSFLAWNSSTSFTIRIFDVGIFSSVSMKTRNISYQQTFWYDHAYRHRFSSLEE